MISYHGTSSYTNHGTSNSLTRREEGTNGGGGGEPYSYTYNYTAAGTIASSGHSSQSYRNESGSASMAGTEIVPNSSGDETTTVGSYQTINETGGSTTRSTWTDTGDGIPFGTNITSSTTRLATSMSFSTSTTTTQTVTRSTSTTATLASSAHAITTNSAGASVTSSTGSTATVTTNTTHTTTRAAPATTSSTIARASRLNFYTILQADTDEVLVVGATTSSGSDYNGNFPFLYSSQRPLGTDLSLTATSIVSLTWRLETTTSFTVPSAMNTYTYTASARATVTTSFTALTSTTSTALVADSADASSQATTTLTVWSTATGTSGAVFLGFDTTGTATATFTAPISNRDTFTHIRRLATTRAFWGHGAGLTATTYSAHACLTVRTVTIEGFTGTGFVLTTSTGTVTSWVQSATTGSSLSYHQPALLADEHYFVTDDLINGDATAESVGASYTIMGAEYRVTESHRIDLRYAGAVMSPGFLPARQVWSAYAASDARYLSLTTSAAGSSATALAGGSRRTVHHADPETSFSHTLGAQQTAGTVEEQRAASYGAQVLSSGYPGFLGAVEIHWQETGAAIFTTGGLGGYEDKRPSFSDLADLSLGCWNATTQEGTSSGTTTYGLTHLTGSDGRRTAIEPAADLTVNSSIAPVFGSFKTTNYAA